MNSEKYDFVIIGGGPAALQMAYYLERAGRSYTVLESNQRAGSFFERFPRHGKLLSINKRFTGKSDPEYNLRHDWNSLLSDNEKMRMTEFTKDYFPESKTFVEYLNKFASEFSLNITYQAKVTAVERASADGAFLITTESGAQFETPCVLVATGLSEPYIPAISGIELVEGYETMSVDPVDFENQSVLILGKGNSAFETADNLIGSASKIHVLSPTPLQLAWESRFVGHLRAVNNNFLDTYHLKSQNAVIDGIVHEISRTSEGKLRVKFGSIHAENETEQLEYDRVLRCTGFRFNNAIFADAVQPKMRGCGRLPLMTSGFEATNVPGMFFLGALTQSLDYRQAQSAFVHGFRYNARSLFHLLDKKYFGKPLPASDLPCEPREMAIEILARMNNVSSLWQQVGFLADMVILPESSGGKAQLIKDLPLEYIREHATALASGRDYYVASFCLGQQQKNPFDNPRNPNPYEGNESSTIHPRIEFYRGGQLVDTFHVLEDFLVDWSGEEYVASTAEFLELSQKGEKLSARPMSDVRHIVRDANMQLVTRVGGMQ